ncbi:hypothetical protein [Roseiflexus castenholzii]|uniref:hypothetical protein n=1 Tax=Roseiflexus castenholzii TaxID=120962 RepID=UPI0012ED3B49|nr:hypothetical protein [Roseiflexus castenholzii]
MSALPGTPAPPDEGAGRLRRRVSGMSALPGTPALPDEGAGRLRRWVSRMPALPGTPAPPGERNACAPRNARAAG